MCAVKHAMIVTEYMENGALDRYLRVRPPHTISTNGIYIFADWKFGLFLDH